MGSGSERKKQTHIHQGAKRKQNESCRDDSKKMLVMLMEIKTVIDQVKTLKKVNNFLETFAEKYHVKPVVRGD